MRCCSLKMQEKNEREREHTTPHLIKAVSKLVDELSGTRKDFGGTKFLQKGLDPSKLKDPLVS